MSKTTVHRMSFRCERECGRCAHKLAQAKLDAVQRAGMQSDPEIKGVIFPVQQCKSIVKDTAICEGDGVYRLFWGIDLPNEIISALTNGPTFERVP